MRRWIRRIFTNQFEITALAAAVLSMTFALYFYTSEPSRRLEFAGVFSRLTPIFALTVGLVAPLSIAMLRYLKDTPTDQVHKSSTYVARKFDNAANRAQALVQDASAKITELQAQYAKGALAISDTALANLKTSVASELATTLEKKFAAEASETYALAQIKATFESTSTRLLKEISSLGLRGNLNLVIGFATTLIAIGALIYMVPSTTLKFSDWTELLSHYLPRLTTVVFIEVFSFFFLRLYKTALAEIKFYQNELTGLAAWQIALDMAYLSKEPANIVLVIDRLVKMRETTPALKIDAETDLVSLKDAGEFVEKVGKLLIKANEKAK
jgi:hypothetical protein